MLIEFTTRFPFVRRYRFPPEVVARQERLAKHRKVKLPDGRIGVVDHEKSSGALAVRPIDRHGNFYPNVTTHWSMEERVRIPEEIVLSSIRRFRR